MIVDSHCHLDDEQFDEDREAVIKDCFAQGLAGMINIGADMASSARSIALAEQYEAIFAAVGVHPHDAVTVKEGDLEQLAQWTTHKKVVLLGEIGLDYYYDHSPRDIQKKVFLEQLAIAEELDIPVTIHDRDAHGDVMAILKQTKSHLRGIIHCFSGSLEMAQELLKKDFYLSVGGPVTFTNNKKLKAIVPHIPLNRLLVETDSPYLSPHPFRGQRNTPARVIQVAQTVADLKGLTYEEVVRQTTQNLHDLLGPKFVLTQVS